MMGAKKLGMYPGPAPRNRFHPWSPASLGEGTGENSLLGLSILSALSVAGIWSAINPSYFTFRSFASKPEAKAIAKEGIWIGLGASTAASLGVWLVFKRLTPAIVSQAVALTLFGISMYAVNAPAVDSIPKIEEQTTT